MVSSYLHFPFCLGIPRYLPTFPFAVEEAGAQVMMCCLTGWLGCPVPISWPRSSVLVHWARWKIVSRVVLVHSIPEGTCPCFPAVVFHSWTPGRAHVWSGMCTVSGEHYPWCFQEAMHLLDSPTTPSTHNKSNKSSDSGKRQIGSACSNWLHWTQAKPPGSYVRSAAFL